MRPIKLMGSIAAALVLVSPAAVASTVPLLSYTDADRSVGVDVPGDGDRGATAEQFLLFSEAVTAFYENWVDDVPETVSGSAQQFSELEPDRIRADSSILHSAALRVTSDGLGEPTGGASARFEVAFVAEQSLEYMFNADWDATGHLAFVEFASTLPYDGGNESPEHGEVAASGTLAAGETASFTIVATVENLAITSGEAQFEFAFTAVPAPTAVPLPAPIWTGGIALAFATGGWIASHRRG